MRRAFRFWRPRDEAAGPGNSDNRWGIARYIHNALRHGMPDEEDTNDDPQWAVKAVLSEIKEQNDE